MQVNANRVYLATTNGGPIMMDVRFRRDYLKEKAVITRRHLPDFQQGTVDLFVLPVDTIADIAIAYAEEAESEGKFRICRTVAEAEAATAAGAIAMMLCANFVTVENPVVGHLMAPLGVRMFSYSLNTRNPLADGCGERAASGLSHLGLDVLKLLESQHVMVDVSHLSDAALADVLTHAQRPVIASHSDCRKLCDNVRNLTDEQIREIAGAGGLVALSTYPTLIRDRGATLEDYLNHVEHAAEVAGVDHVALGADFVAYARDLIMPKVHATDRTGGIYGEGYEAPTGLVGIQDMGAIVPGLERRGWKDSEIRKVARENFLALMRLLEG